MSVDNRNEQHRLAWEAFQRDFPKLYEEWPTYWVAYQGNQILGHSLHRHLLYDECRDRGLQPEDFSIFAIVPQQTEIQFAPVAVDANGRSILSNPAVWARKKLAWKTFVRDLPKLYEERPEQFVAYHGDQILLFGKEKHLLYPQCNALGFDDEEFSIFYIAPLEEFICLDPEVTD